MPFNSLQFALFSPIVTLLCFALPHRRRGTPLLLASCVFYMAVVSAYLGILAVPILIDYGYSDIAIGSAQVMGVTLMHDFDRPYTSRSIAELWRRWHVSLSIWFRDHLYTPLGGNRVARPRPYANLLITFLVSGLWHGVRWTFVVCGALHGAYLIASLHTERTRARIRDSLGLTPARRPRSAGAHMCARFSPS